MPKRATAEEDAKHLAALEASYADKPYPDDYPPGCLCLPNGVYDDDDYHNPNYET